MEPCRDSDKSENINRYGHEFSLLLKQVTVPRLFLALNTLKKLEL